MVALLSLGLALSLAPGVSFAQDDHLAQAISHTREAVVAGHEGNLGALVQHATTALEHADAAQQEQPNTYVRAGIQHLKSAIKHGKKRHIAAAVNRATLALHRFKHALR
jgi:hypothetical protein